MRKTIIFLILAFTFLLVSPIYAGSDETQLKNFLEVNPLRLTNDEIELMVELARKVTNDELKPLNFGQNYYSKNNEDGFKLNGSDYLEYEVLVYGDRFGTFDRGEQRYLGYTLQGEAYTNTFFRPDFLDFVQIDNANWVYHPVKNDSVNEFVLNKMREPKGLEPKKFNYQQRFRNNILWGFQILNFINPEYYKINLEASQDRDWENYIHILQPPSKYCWGTGRMFRQLRDGSIRYMDVPLVSFDDLEFDLAVNIKEECFKGSTGGKFESTATFELNKDCVIPRTAKLRVYMKMEDNEFELQISPTDPAKKLNGNNYTFQPGEKLEVKFSFTVPDRQAEIVVRVDPSMPRPHWIEVNQSNNEDRAPVIVGLYDVKVKIVPDEDEYISLDGDDAAVSYNVRITRKDSVPGDIEVSLTANDPSGRYTERFITGTGYKDIPFDFPAGAGSYTIEAEAWPVGRQDAYPSDNRDVIPVLVKNQEFDVDSKIHVELIDN